MTETQTQTVTRESALIEGDLNSETFREFATQMQPPCEMNGHEIFGLDVPPARWIFHKLCPSCGDRKHLLGCDVCKTAILDDQSGLCFWCMACEAGIMPPRLMFDRIEAL